MAIENKRKVKKEYYNKKPSTKRYNDKKVETKIDSKKISSKELENKKMVSKNLENEKVLSEELENRKRIIEELENRKLVEEIENKKAHKESRNKKITVKKLNIGAIIKLVIAVITMVLTIYCLVVIGKLDMLPTRLFVILITGNMFLNVINILSLLSRKKVLNLFGIIISIIMIIVSVLGIKHGTKIVNFMNSAFNNNGIEVTTYNIAVLKSSDYKDIKDLEGKILAYSLIDETKEDYEKAINTKVSVTLKEYDNPIKYYDDLLKKKVDAIVITDGSYQVLEDEYADIDERIKVIYNFDIEKKVELEPEADAALKPVNILISGSDSRTGKLADKTRSDVNMIVTINPYTHKVLLTSIPRDYYVQLHGTTGVKDKLTNSGIYGINKTKQTIEDLFGIKIDYTLKVGFQSVIKIVDLVGGVDIYSDTAFVSHCDDGGAKSVKVKVGMNHFNGAQALSYARERYAYRNGDHHRIKNQQQVLEAVLNKIMKDKSILLKYDEILDSLKTAYKTSIPGDFIKAAVKAQIDDMPSWKIEKQQVTGGGYMRETYSAGPGKLRSVVIPDMDSVKKATKEIVKFMSEK